MQTVQSHNMSTSFKWIDGSKVCHSETQQLAQSYPLLTMVRVVEIWDFAHFGPDCYERVGVSVGPGSQKRSNSHFCLFCEHLALGLGLGCPLHMLLDAIRRDHVREVTVLERQAAFVGEHPVRCLLQDLWEIRRG